MKFTVSVLVSKNLKEEYTSFEDLDLMILNGWGNVKQFKLPKDWRTRKNPHLKVLAKEVFSLKYNLYI